MDILDHWIILNLFLNLLVIMLIEWKPNIELRYIQCRGHVTSNHHNQVLKLETNVVYYSQSSYKDFDKSIGLDELHALSLSIIWRKSTDFH